MCNALKHLSRSRRPNYRLTGRWGAVQSRLAVVGVPALGRGKHEISVHIHTACNSSAWCPGIGDVDAAATGGPAEVIIIYVVVVVVLVAESI